MDIEYVYTDAEKDFLLRIIKTKIAPILEGLAKGGLNYAWEQWMMEVNRQRKVEAEIQLRKDVVAVMKTSERGNRTAAEKELIMQYVSKLSCIPSDTSSVAMETLCNEIDFYPCVDAKSIMFLQGDFGNCYYMIGDGAVDLYLVQGKDKEMDIGREFGALRGVSYTGTDFSGEVLKEEDQKKGGTMLNATVTENGELLQAQPPVEETLSPIGTNSALGKKIVTLEAGRGFGEFAILSNAGKIRMCSAVTATTNTFCFILHAPTYNAVLKQHHYRSSKLTAATALLTEMPVFNAYSQARLASIAYNMQAFMYQNTAKIVQAGSVVRSVLVVHSGSVRVVQERDFGGGKPSGDDGGDEEEEEREEMTAEETLLRRLPRLAVSILGRGSVIGEWEVLQGRSAFEMTYISNSSDCEVFEMPLSTYRECCMDKSNSEHTADLMREKAKLAERREVRTRGRLERAEDKIKKMALVRARMKDDQTALLRMLPVLIDGVTLEGGAGVGESSNKKQGSDSWKHRNQTSQDIVDSRLGEHGPAAAADHHHLGDEAAAYGYDPAGRTFLEQAWGGLPQSPTSNSHNHNHNHQPGNSSSPRRSRSRGRGRSRGRDSNGNGSPPRVRMSSRGNNSSSTAHVGSPRISRGGSRSPSRGNNGSGIVDHRFDGALFQGGAQQVGLLNTMLLSPPGSARGSKPSPRATRVLSASSYRD
jgi:CRP-like cAMP-binding protein